MKCKHCATKQEVYRTNKDLLGKYWEKYRLGQVITKETVKHIGKLKEKKQGQLKASLDL